MMVKVARTEDWREGPVLDTGGSQLIVDRISKWPREETGERMSQSVPGPWTAGTPPSSDLADFEGFLPTLNVSDGIRPVGFSCGL